MSWLTRYLWYDPGYMRLKLATRAVLTVVIVICLSVILQMKLLTIVFVGLIANFSMVNLQGESQKEKRVSALRAGLIMIAAAGVGFAMPPIPWLYMGVLLIAVFGAYYVTRFGSQWLFHPVFAVVLLMLAMDLPVPASMLDTWYNFVWFAALGWGVGFLCHFVLFKDNALVGSRHNTLAVLARLGMCYSNMAVAPALARAHLKKVKLQSEALLQLKGRWLSTREGKQDMADLFVLRLYALVQVVANMLEAVDTCLQAWGDVKAFQHALSQALEELTSALGLLLKNFQQGELVEKKESTPIAILSVLLKTLPSQKTSLALNELYILCFGYRRSFELLAMLDEHLHQMRAPV